MSRHIDALRSQPTNSRIGWERPEKLHITLKFLGETDGAMVSKLVTRLEDCGGDHRELKLRLFRPGVFPSRSRPRVLWIGVDGDTDRLAEIHNDIETVCEEFGIERDKRRFKPHLTIGRVRHGGADPTLVERHLKAEVEPVEFNVSAIVVYESRLHPTGSVYSVIGRAALSAG